MGKKAAAKRFLAVTQSLSFLGGPASYYPLLEATSSLMCCHVEKRSRSEMPRRDHLLSNARAVSLLRRRLQKPCKQRVKACEKRDLTQIGTGSKKVSLDYKRELRVGVMIFQHCAEPS